MREYRKFYIDGAWVDPVQAQPFPLISPATEEAIGSIALGSAADVDRAVAVARRPFTTWSRTSIAERLALIARIVEVYKRRYDDVADAICTELGAPLAFAKRSQTGLGSGHMTTMLKVLPHYPFVPP